MKQVIKTRSKLSKPTPANNQCAHTQVLYYALADSSQNILELRARLA
jgi:hypothetical protein